MEKLRISDNRRYLVTDSGKPVVWIADTDWTMPQRMKWDDVDYFMKVRKQQGFTALQICALDPERDVEMRNPAGDKALINDDLNQPNENYFRYLDYVLDKAEEYGLYVLLLPVWGQLVVGEDWEGNTYEKTVTEENAFAYGRWIGERYGKRSNVLWCLGGDRQPIHRQKLDCRDVWRRMAEGLAKGVTGYDLKYNVKDPHWQDMLITYHACREAETGECSTFSYWTDEEAWISFIMLQSGHGLTVRNDPLVKKEYEREITMPVWDGEPGYEAMPTCWPIEDANSFHGTEVINRRAYASLLAGAFGYTYGHASVWCSISEKEKNFIAFTDWYESLHSEGSKMIGHIHSFIEDMGAWEMIPKQEIILDQDEENAPYNRHISAGSTSDGNAMCVYFPSGEDAELNLNGFAGSAGKLYGWWFNPRDGRYYDAKLSETSSEIEYSLSAGKLYVQTPDQEEKKDWLLILKKESGEAPIKVRDTEVTEESGEIKKVFEW